MKLKTLSLLALAWWLGACSQEPATPPAAPANTTITKQDQDQAKLAFIRGLYDDERRYIQAITAAQANNRPLPDNDAPTPFLLRLDPDFAKLLNASSDPNESDCWLDYDPVWASQDPQINVDIAFSITPEGWVKAAFSQYGAARVVLYDVDCAQGQCKIKDLPDADDAKAPSLRQSLQACLQQASANQVKVQFIRELYQAERSAYQKHSATGNMDDFFYHRPFHARLSADFKKLLTAQDSLGVRLSDTCVLDADPVWASQDPQLDVDVDVVATPEGLVKVTFPQYGETREVLYDVKCTQAQCAIEDLPNVDDANAPSLKQWAKSCVQQEKH